MSYPDLTWMDTAACTRPEHHQLPWLAEPEQLSPDELTRLRQVCSGCPVAAPCDQYAARHRVRTGAGPGHTAAPANRSSSPSTWVASAASMSMLTEY